MDAIVHGLIAIGLQSPSCKGEYSMPDVVSNSYKMLGDKLRAMKWQYRRLEQGRKDAIEDITKYLLF